MTPSITIAGRRIGPGEPAYVIAELSANHHHDFDQALAIVRAAHDAGADAIKLQTYTPDTLTIDSDTPPFQIGAGSLWSGQTLHALYRQAYMPWDWTPKLMAEAASLGLHCFSTPFDRTAVDFLEALHVPAYKIASFELVDTPLIAYVARLGKPMILSTGLSTLPEIERAVAAARVAGDRNVALLKCNSAYPAPPDEMNLRTIADMSARFGVPVGLSDHTLGTTVAIAAVSAGACIVEKHLTLSRATPGPDAAFSMEPREFREMVDGIRLAERALGSVSYEPTGAEQRNRVFRRSLFAVADIAAGEAFTDANVRSIRPGSGLPPHELPRILGRHAAQNIARGTPLSWDLVAGQA